MRHILKRGVVYGMFLWEGCVLRSMCDLGARDFSLQEVRTCGRGMLL